MGQKMSQSLRTNKNHATSQYKKTSRNLLGQHKKKSCNLLGLKIITQPLGTKIITQPLWTKKGPKWSNMVQYAWKKPKYHELNKMAF